jgi:SPX domain protein involved in polyphosphate accumulation
MTAEERDRLQDEVPSPLPPVSPAPQIDVVATKFLKLEKFVNLNFTAFHKILKKHDKRLPNPCKAFYISRLHDQKWVRGDYSDVIVSMSNLYSSIRGDEEVVANDNEKQVSEERERERAGRERRGSSVNNDVTITPNDLDTS